MPLDEPFSETKRNTQDLMIWSVVVSIKRVAILTSRKVMGSWIYGNDSPRLEEV